MGYKSKETLTALIKYKSSCLSPKLSPTYFQPRKPLFKDSIALYGLSYVFPYNQIRVDDPLLHAIANYWVPTWHIFRFNEIELCPTTEEFGAIIGKSKIDDLIFPTMGGDLPSLLQVVLGVPLLRL